jgi:hypothetical protein
MPLEGRELYISDRVRDA